MNLVFESFMNSLLKKIPIDIITKFVMVLLVIMGLVLVLMETVIDPVAVGLY